MKDQSVGGKLLDAVYLLGVFFLWYQGKINEGVGLFLIGGWAQARGVVGAVGKVMTGGGTPSERPPGGGGPGSSGSMRRVQLPPETPERGPHTYVKRLAIGAIREQSTIGWGLAALAVAIGGLLGSISRVRGASVALGAMVFALGCVR